ncbi:MAG: hypothetical protein DRP45_02045 [Candidatus Zixiibacteriota bacterium]|nr:MAG: hypothetical protein DRP45_02045 [candidate division Zixibacteria bacterium]
MAYLGDYLIFTAAACSLFSCVAYLLVWRGRDRWLRAARIFFRVTTGFLVAATAGLLYLIVTHDFTVSYVYSYSSTDLPLHYLISALWGGQEGTLLLWAMLTGVIGLFLIPTARQFEKGNMFWLNLFMMFILAILIKKSPFELLPVVPTEGAGLNPLLQNFWMTLHPPLMFVAYAAIVVPFCFVMTALVERKYDVWAEAAKRWTIFAWTVLGISIVMGCWWSYETLGWGGYWGWDPVENASLIPWILLTAQIHTLFVMQHRRGLIRFSVVMVCLTFLSVLYGTFLTRSGVLGDFSVHSFVDLGINQILVFGLILFMAVSAVLVAIRWRDIATQPWSSKVNSRTYLTGLGIIVLSIGGVLVLLGTSAPLITRLTENPSSVDLHYYFVTMAPVAVILLLLTAGALFFRWSAGLNRPIWLLVAGITFVVTVTALVITGVTTQIIYLLLFGSAVAALVSGLVTFAQGLGAGKFRPGPLSHIGLALMILGAAASGGLETKETLSLPQGEKVSSMGYDLTFTDITDSPKGYDCLVDVTGNGDHFVGMMSHEFNWAGQNMMKKPHIQRSLLYDLYLSPLALERTEESSPGDLYLEKNQSATLDKYQITFLDFEVGGHESGGAEMSVATVVEISYDGISEIVRPRLVALGEDMSRIPATFDSNRGELRVVGIHASDGAVVLEVSGDFVPTESVKPETFLVVELSRKPLIQLFWLGTLLIFASGITSLLQKRRTIRTEH